MATMSSVTLRQVEVHSQHGLLTVLRKHAQHKIMCEIAKHSPGGENASNNLLVQLPALWSLVATIFTSTGQ